MPNDSAKKLAKNMKRIRKEEGASQSNICRTVNIDHGYISSIENANRSPTLATVEKIARALEVEIGNLTK